jgi:CRISPR-associated protein Cmr1
MSARRTPPPIAPAEVARRAVAIEETREYRFLTWTFGGGVRVCAHRKLRDEVTPVRGASLRGQLRFWWRAANPSGCRTLAKLRAREAEVWGATSAASPVALAVTVQPPAPQEVKVYDYRPDRTFGVCRGMEAWAYGAFPLQPDKEALARREQPGVLHDATRGTFKLTLRYPEGLAADVQEALWAWEAFGGLGARTRRGFGAVQRVPPPALREIERGLARCAERPRIAGVPSLAGARFAQSRTTKATALDAWKEGLGLLRKIRQGERFGRNPGSDGRPGRSRWPEPDEIRELTGKRAPRHRERLVEVPSFPRAAFGLPIVFHFKDKGAGDPDCKPLELRPADFERFASPLILRPVADGDDFRTVALVLGSDLPDARLVAGAKSFPVATDLSPAGAARIPALVRGAEVFTDPIDLFLWELKRC